MSVSVADVVGIAQMSVSVAYVVGNSTDERECCGCRRKYYR
jgi:hypothetical protein